MSTSIWKKVARRVVRAGVMPFPITDNLIAFLKALMTEEQAKFLLNFSRTSLNLDQIKEKSDLSEEEILKMLDSLMDGGIISGTTSKSMGIMVYSLMPPLPGLIEFSLMKGNKGEREKRIVGLIEKIFNDLREGFQGNFDEIAAQLKNFPMPARVAPVEKFVEVGQALEVGQERVLLAEEVSKLVDHYETIAKTHCYCKQEKDILNDPCKFTDKREICLIFDKAAQNAIDHGFATKVTKDEAKEILKIAEDAGLVHKVFHSKLDLTRDLDGICSCCKCCCGIFRLYYEGVTPFHTLTSYIAKNDSEKCIACGLCEEKCSIEAISLEDYAVIDEERCIGCGVCAHLCPEGAMSIERTGAREVFLVPPRLKQN